MKISERIAEYLSFSSLRVRLQMLVWIAIIPMLLLIVLESMLDRSRKEAEIRESVRGFVDLAADGLEQHINNTRNVLLTMSHSDVIQKGDPAAVSAFFRDMHKHYPEYANFGAVDLQGNVFASAVRMKKPVNVSDLYYFQQTLKSRAFTVGGYQIGRITGLEIILFGQPVFDPVRKQAPIAAEPHTGQARSRLSNGVDKTGNMKLILFASMDMTWMNRLWENVKLLPDSTLTVTDHSGTILFRYPHAADKWIGKNMAQVPIISAMLAKGNGITETNGLDKKNRIYAFTVTDNQRSDIHMAVGVSKKVALAPINRMLAINLSALVLVAMLGLYVARLYSNKFIMTPIKALEAAADRFAAGDYSCRINMTDGKNELIAYANIFDKMAETIETKTKDLRLFRALIDKSNDAIFLAGTETGGLIDVNEKACTTLGYSRQELLNMHVIDVDAITIDYSQWREHVEEVKKRGILFLKVRTSERTERYFLLS